MFDNEHTRRWDFGSGFLDFARHPIFRNDEADTLTEVRLKCMCGNYNIDVNEIMLH